jgi:hypothetical protein
MFNVKLSNSQIHLQSSNHPIIQSSNHPLSTWIIECTYQHFEQSSHCPICQKTLTENDFTELVVADATNSSADITKTSLQALFSKQSKTSNLKGSGLPYSDLCFSLIRQIDVVKQSTKFLLKQLLMNSNSQSRKVAVVFRHNEKLKSDMTLLKQGQSTQRIQYEQVNNDLKNRLNARESRIQELNAKLAEKERMIEQFQRLHSGHGSSGGGGNGGGLGSVSVSASASASHPKGHSHSTASVSGQSYHQIPPSTSASNRHHGDRRSRGGGDGNGGGIMDRHRNNSHQLSSGSSIASTTAGVEPPLKGLMMQRQAHQIAQQQAFVSKRGPNMPPSSSGMSRMSQQQQQQQQHHHSMGPPSAPGFPRPYSSNNSISSNSLNSNTPRVRDLSHGTAFNFTSGSGNSISNGSNGGGGGGHRLNKRRRRNDNHSATPSHAMSPNTAFTLNQGAHSANRGQRWLQRDGRSYSRG